MDLLTPPAAPTEPPAPSTPPTQTPTPAPAAAAPEFNPSLPENWYLAGGDAFAAEAATLGRFKSVTDLAQSYVHLRKHGAAYPSEQSTIEDVERFRALAQVPPTPDAYGITAPEKLPEGLQWDQASVDSFAAIAHKHHVPAPAFKALVEAFTANEAGKAAAFQAEQQQQFAATQAELIKELGPSPLDFERNAAQVNHIVAVLAEKANIDPTDPGLAAIRGNAAMIKILNQVAKMTAEDPTRAPAGYGDLRSSRQKAADIMEGRDPEWSQKYKEGDLAATRKVEALLKASK